MPLVCVPFAIPFPTSRYLSSLFHCGLLRLLLFRLLVDGLSISVSPFVFRVILLQSSLPLAIQTSCGSAVVSPGYFSLLLSVAPPAAAAAALIAETRGSFVSAAALQQLLQEASTIQRSSSHRCCPSFLEAAAATAAAAAAATVAERASAARRQPHAVSPLSPYRSGASSPGVPPPLQRDWRCVLLCLPRRPSLEVGRLQRLDEVPFSLYPYQQRLADALDALAAAERRRANLSRRLSAWTSSLPGASGIPQLTSTSSSSVGTAAASSTSGGRAGRGVSAVVGGVTDGFVQLPASGGLTGRAPAFVTRAEGGPLPPTGRLLDGKSVSLSGGGTGGGMAGLPDLASWRPRGEWLRNLTDFEAFCSQGGGSLSLAATDDGRLLCAAPLGLKGGEVRAWKASSLLNHSRRKSLHPSFVVPLLSFTYPAVPLEQQRLQQTDEVGKDFLSVFASIFLCIQRPLWVSGNFLLSCI